MKQFGVKATKEQISRYAQSPNWRDGKFQNLEETTMSINFQTLPKLLYKQFCERKEREPKRLIPVVPFNKESFLAPSDKAKVIWYGHSAVLMRINNKTLLIDPMLGPNASPIAPFATKRYSENTLALIDDFPTIDLLLLTHDHYDHLDLDSFKKLLPKVDKYFVALGTARHLIGWGADESKITEFDWWDDQEFEDIAVTFTPSRHFSGRGLTDRAKSLWGGWVFKTKTENIYWSGDGGYGDHFREVGDRLGPFDFGMMECGQYDENWHQIHMYPEEAVQAALDAGVKKVMAVHWAGFALAQHRWKDPIERFTAEAKDKKLNVLTPQIGEQFHYDDKTDSHWWEKFE
ncbi:MAG: MBL fold metallo-hydrolase [Cyclobacteriaceae bacterium]